MYCVKCGVELPDNVRFCPICHTKAYYPDGCHDSPKPPFPEYQQVKEELNECGKHFIFSFVFIVAALLTAVCDISLNHTITWSAYVLTSLSLIFVLFVLPLWMRKIKLWLYAVIDAFAVLLFLLFITSYTNGNWFISFAMPIILLLTALVIFVMTTMYLKKDRRLYIFGTASIFFGIINTITELCLDNTFGYKGIVWSQYPLTVFLLMGIMLILIGRFPSLRRSLYKKFFI